MRMQEDTVSREHAISKSIDPRCVVQLPKIASDSKCFASRLLPRLAVRDGSSAIVKMLECTYCRG